MLPLRTLSCLAFRPCRNRAFFNPTALKLSNYTQSLPKTILHVRIRTLSTAPAVLEDYTGQSGRKYKIQRVLQEETFPQRRVCLATADNQHFILKFIHEVNFGYLQDINNKLRDGATHVRLAQDIVPEKSMFVFKYFTGHLLHLAQKKNLSLELKKRILKNALRGIAELHAQDIVHTDIKANNIFIDWKSCQNGIIIDQVQLGDLEDAAHIPPGSHLVGKQAGNWMWRSPEAHANGPVNKPSDIFSFALVCIYAMHKRIIFAVGEEELEEGVDPLAIVIERQISYFADEEGITGFLRHLGDNPWARVFEIIRDGFNGENPRKPFSLWKGVDEDFKSLISAMTHFDPEKRITAKEALAHEWFEGV